MDQDGGGLDATDELAPRVVPERAHVAVRLDLAVGIDPGGAPAVAGEPEPLETLAEVPQVLEKKRFRGARDELLAHALDDRRGSRRRPPVRPSRERHRRRISASYSGKYVAITVRSNERRIDVSGSRARRNANERGTRSSGWVAPGASRSRSARATVTSWCVASRSTRHRQPSPAGSHRTWIGVMRLLAGSSDTRTSGAAGLCRGGRPR